MTLRLCRECDGEGIVVVGTRYDEGQLRFEHGPCPACVDGWEEAPSRSGCFAVLGLIALSWILIAVVLAIIVATPRSGQTTDRVDMSPVASAGLSGAPQQATSPHAPRLRSVSEVGSDAPYPADRRVSPSGAP